MQRLFFGIYGAILACTLLVLALSYFALSSLNQHRYKTYLEEVMHSTTVLIHRGINRQEAQNQQRWIDLASSLLAADLTVHQVSVSEKAVFAINTSSDHDVVADSQTVSEKYLLTYQADGSPQQLRLEFDGITEQVLTATAFFMLNELGRLPANERQTAFDALTTEFNYPVYRARQEDLPIDSRQQERLLRGETVVTLQRQLGQNLAFNVYAPWGKTSDALVMGPIGFFDPFPAYMAATVLGFALLLLAILLMSIIRKLSKRLIALQDKVDAIRPEADSTRKDSRVEESEAEVITGLSDKIQNMAERIEKLLAEKAYMIRAVSHDLRTPISKIHFRLEALTEKLGPENKLIRGCQDDLRQLNLLIDELLTYEKLSANSKTARQSQHFKAVNLLTVMREQLDGVQVLYPVLTTDLNSEVPADEQSEVNIQGNEVLLHRMFENLLQNAGRHARQKITVTLSIETEKVLVVIDDDGEGLAAESIPNLFEPFFRADESRTASKGGYGLGLAIVKQVVMQHGGEIQAGNNTSGGASFKLSLPRHVSMEQNASTQNVRKNKADLS